MQNITIAGNQYPDVPAITVPKTGGGTARFTDVSDTTATAADVADGKKIYLADGTPATGTYAWNWMGKDATCIEPNLFSLTKALEDTDYATWTPTTIGLTIIASEKLDPITIDMGTYNYIVLWRAESSMVYLSGATLKNLIIRQVFSVVSETYKRASNPSYLQTPNYNTATTMSLLGYVSYYNSSGAEVFSMSSINYGPRLVTPANPSISLPSSNIVEITIKSPSMQVNCSNTYFSTTNAGYVDQHNSVVKLKGELWRVKRSSATESRYNDLASMWINPI